MNGDALAQPRYFLSVYMPPCGTGAILSDRHDHALALWCVVGNSASLLRYWEFERYSGQKHHYWPLFTPAARDELFSELLAEEGLSLDDIEDIWGLSDLGSNRWRSSLAAATHLPVHSVAHFMSAVGSDSDLLNHATIVGLAVDGGPDFVLEESDPQYWYAGGVCKAGKIELTPVESPAALYIAAVSVLGLQPGALMALAGACECQVDWDSDLYVRSCTFFGGGDTVPTAIEFVTDVLHHADTNLPGPAKNLCGETRLTREEHVGSAVMKVVQAACLMIMDRNVRRLISEHSVAPTDAFLATAGGYALNCPTNTYLMDTYGFRGLLTPPCADDSGQALGLGLLALYAESLEAGSGFSFHLPGAYVGSRHVGLEAALQHWQPWIRTIESYRGARFAEDVMDGPVAWVDGAAEIGPRALGHRSLLADPRTLISKQRLNDAKGRRWWRPVAPIVQEEHVGQWFAGARRSPYMLEAFAVRDDCRARVPAIVHQDGTARVQTLSAQDDARLYEALEAFRRRAGVPMLCNTSLNDKGEPIVNDAHEALTFCIRKGIGVAYIEGTRIELRDTALGTEAPGRPASRRFEKRWSDPAEHRRLWSEFMASGLGAAEAFLLSRSPHLVPLTATPRGVRKIRAAARLAARANRIFTRAATEFSEALGPESDFRPGDHHIRVLN